MGEEGKMKRSLVLFIVVVMSAVVPSTAAAYLLSAELLAFIASVPATNDFAVGEGKFSKGQPAEQFNIAAHGSPIYAKGHVRFNSDSFGEARGEVDCLLVSGNQAGIAGTFDDPPDDQFPYFVVAVEDNGEPSGASPDRAVLIEITAPPGPDCGLSTVGFATTIRQGNIVVKDRP
jgi:hypothetical protein